MKRIAPLVIGLLIVLAAGVLHAMWTDRWGTSVERQRAVQALEAIPMVVGEWDGRSLTMSARELEIAEADGYIMREYVHRGSGNVVALTIVCGRPGPISVHPPEVCYQGAGYQLAGGTAKYTASAAAGIPGAEFNVVDFRKAESATPAHLRVYYTWGREGRWTAPARPRLAFAMALQPDPVLFKVYVVRHKTAEATPVDKDPCVEFIRLLLPSLQETLFSGS